MTMTDSLDCFEPLFLVAGHLLYQCLGVGAGCLCCTTPWHREQRNEQLWVLILQHWLWVQAVNMPCQSLSPLSLPHLLCPHLRRGTFRCTDSSPQCGYHGPGQDCLGWTYVVTGLTICQLGNDLNHHLNLFLRN